MIKPSYWKTLAMPNETESFYSGRSLVPDEYSKLSKGLKPESMDDKGFVYSLDGFIYFHRSWLGHFIFIVKIEKMKEDVFFGM